MLLRTQLLYNLPLIIKDTIKTRSRQKLQYTNWRFSLNRCIGRQTARPRFMLAASVPPLGYHIEEFPMGQTQADRLMDRHQTIALQLPARCSQHNNTSTKLNQLHVSWHKVVAPISYAGTHLRSNPRRNIRMKQWKKFQETKLIHLNSPVLN